MELKRDKAVQDIFDNYPQKVRPKMESLRQLVIETAQGIDEVKKLEETLKWGEPSYLTKTGTTLRMDWKSKNPHHYAMYFQCTSMMIPTIKKVFGNQLSYETNRAVIFGIDESLPVESVKECIRMAFTYHQFKHLPFLGQ